MGLLFDQLSKCGDLLRQRFELLGLLLQKLADKAKLIRTAARGCIFLSPGDRRSGGNDQS